MPGVCATEMWGNHSQTPPAERTATQHPSCPEDADPTWTPGGGQLHGVGGMSAGRGGSVGVEERLGAEPAHPTTTPAPSEHPPQAKGALRAKNTHTKTSTPLCPQLCCFPSLTSGCGDPSGRGPSPPPAPLGSKNTQTQKLLCKSPKNPSASRGHHGYGRCPAGNTALRGDPCHSTAPSHPQGFCSLLNNKSTLLGTQFLPPCCCHGVGGMGTQTEVGHTQFRATTNIYMYIYYICTAHPPHPAG